MIPLYLILYVYYAKGNRKIEQNHTIGIILLFMTQGLIVENVRDYVDAKCNIILLYIFIITII